MASPSTTYTEQDLQDAVRDGALSETAADAFRSYLASRSPHADEEEFHLLRGFNDVFVAVASVLLLVGIAWFTASLSVVAAFVLVAVVAVALSEYFTLRRRLALSSIVFVLAASMATVTAVFWVFWSEDHMVQIDGTRRSLLFAAKFGTLLALACGAVTGALFWWRYRIPIAVAVGVFFLCVVLYGAWVVFSPLDNPFAGGNVALFVFGFAAFCFAMYWDVRDPARGALESDVAFWLHLLAAPAIAHPVFRWVQSGDLPSDWLDATAVVGCYLCLACIAVIVNRRAIMVAATAYLIGAVAWYFEDLSALRGVAIALVLIGFLFLALAVWWSTIRSAMIRCLPGAVRGLIVHA